MHHYRGLEDDFSLGSGLYSKTLTQEGFKLQRGHDREVVSWLWVGRNFAWSLTDPVLQNRILTTHLNPSR